MAERTVVALGGNAFVPEGGELTMAGQFRFARDAMGRLLPVFAPDRQVLVTHGNGPQVGHMLTRVEEALGKAYAVPLEVCVAESEGELGYVLGQSLHNTLMESGHPRPIVSVLTQVVVDRDDPAFANPTKPIGPYYDAVRAAELESRGYAMAEESGRGFRRVVPSPKPLDVVEIGIVDELLSLGIVVIAAGGGGVPVVRRGEELVGVDAVVDKDFASALLAERLGAGLLLILTGVPCAYADYGRDAQRPLARLMPAEVRSLAAAGHFPEGSMGPKMEAAAGFVERTGGHAIITDPANAAAALRDEAGTHVATD
jgi:carbamate kinase